MPRSVHNDEIDLSDEEGWEFDPYQYHTKYVGNKHTEEIVLEPAQLLSEGEARVTWHWQPDGKQKFMTVRPHMFTKTQTEASSNKRPKFHYKFGDEKSSGSSATQDVAIHVRHAKDVNMDRQVLEKSMWFGDVDDMQTTVFKKELYDKTDVARANVELHEYIDRMNLFLGDGYAGRTQRSNQHVVVAPLMNRQIDAEIIDVETSTHTSAVEEELRMKLMESERLRLEQRERSLEQETERLRLEQLEKSLEQERLRQLQEIHERSEHTHESNHTHTKEIIHIHHRDAPQRVVASIETQTGNTIRIPNGHAVNEKKKQNGSTSTQTQDSGRRLRRYEVAEANGQQQNGHSQAEDIYGYKGKVEKVLVTRRYYDDKWDEYAQNKGYGHLINRERRQTDYNTDMNHLDMYRHNGEVLRDVYNALGGIKARKDWETESTGSRHNANAKTGRYSMMEYSKSNFRSQPDRYVMSRNQESGEIHGKFNIISSIKAKTREKFQPRKSKEFRQREQVDMVRWTQSPIQASLLRFESEELNRLSLECFIAIMRYMGDYPLAKGQKQVDCVYTILMSCHNHPELRDEVYNQLIKQTTSNKSTQPESLTNGWRLFMIATAYFDCSDPMKPYLFKYLEENAYDQSRPHHNVALVSLQSLRATLRYGGRKNVPSRTEVDAISRGRNMKRQMVVLPGGVPVVLNAKSCSVINDAIDQICLRLNIDNPLEKEEFTIFYVIEKENRYCALARIEYIFDITTELANQRKEFYMLFQRTSWIFPLRLDSSPLYVDVIYHQAIPDYTDGFLLAVPPNGNLSQAQREEIAMLGALQLRASDKATMPNTNDVQSVIPKNAWSESEVKPQQWVNMVHDKQRELNRVSPRDSKVMFLELLQKWKFFGSTFFGIKSTSEDRVPGDALLAINKSGVYFIHTKSHEIIVRYPLEDIISTRRFHAAEGRKYFLDMKVGNLMAQKFVRMETDQGADIANLIGQYIQLKGKSRY